jgi:hypothetical protein
MAGCTAPAPALLSRVRHGGHGFRRVGGGTDAGVRDAGVVSNRAGRQRRHGPTPTTSTEFDEFDEFEESEGFDPDELCVIVNYRRSPLGAWTASLGPDGPAPMTRQAASAHDAFHAAMDVVEALSQYAEMAISTVHTLDGDPAAWATLAAREGFLDCALTDHTLADLITHS